MLLVLLVSNLVFQSIDSVSALSLPPSLHYASNDIIFSSIPNIKSPLLRSAVNNDTLLILAGPTLIDGTGNSPKQNAIIIIKGTK